MPDAGARPGQPEKGRIGGRPSPAGQCCQNPAVHTTRWTRYGKDRLYVRDDGGAELGWWDLKNEAAHPAPGVAADLIERVAREWLGRQADEPGVVAEASAQAHRFAAEADPVPAPLEEPSSSDPEPETSWVLDFVPAGASDGGVSFVPFAEWAEPEPPDEPEHPAVAAEPAVSDLLFNQPAQQLREQVAAAHAAGEVPTFWRRFRLGKNAWSTWELGSVGERLVFAELERFVLSDRRWGVLNSIEVGSNGSDIDFLLIGPGGVFTINAKFHHGARIWVAGNTFMINGTRHPYIRNSRHEAARAARLLTRAAGFPVAATGMVVPVNAGDFTIREQPEDVIVVNRARLYRLLRRLPDVLDSDTVQAVFEAARRSDTWLTPQREPGRRR